ncbi:MAG TPA: twin-arginine translocase subunit TatC, partial [Blastocatellia bacterium]|nr:twin-arginine translocase subunit TatC [Blastocatellia bacterium]
SNEEDHVQMSFLDHLDELRKRLVHSAIAIAIAFAIAFAFSDYIYKFLAKPVMEQSRKARLAYDKATSGGKDNLDQLKEGAQIQYTFPTEAAVNGIKLAAGTTIPAKIIKGGDGQLTAVTAQPWVVGKSLIQQDTIISGVFGETTLPGSYADMDKPVIRSVQGAFTLYMTVALYTAIALSIPFLLYQIWAFVSPGLYKHEKKYITPIMIMGFLFFVLGATFAYTIAFPAAANYLLGLAIAGEFRTLIDADSYFDLITMIMLGLGIVFQIPTVAFILGRIGLVTPRMLWRAWRYAIVIIALISAVLTPTADAVNMLIFAAPMILLYILSIGIVWIFGKPRRSDDEVNA